MNKVLLASLLSCTIGNVYSACNYDLEGFINDPENPTAQKFPTVIGQKVTYKIINLPKDITYSANHSAYNNNNGTLTGLLPTSNNGIVGFELRVDTISEELKETNTDVKTFNIVGLGANNDPIGITAIFANNSDIQNYKKPLLIWVIQKNSSTNENEITYSYLQPYDSTPTQNIGIYLNQNTNQLGLIVNKKNLGYVTSLKSKLKSITFQPQAFIKGFEANSQYLNKTMSMELVTDKSKFTNAFPTGTTDICGN
ncbi:DUF4882 family protein [Acinetobacter gerneri]|jgi:hypothetical protein|uniref:DUF4882 family protein n=1 Tax=Acinetobacter gerneri TaxID=202952 RepID=UPI0023F4233D|nr:DUF4882 family protein [Acinetobacter gerneri]MCH4243436.1 DUF4882 domain-containing protein [Acinetobacter gerneri]